LEINKRIVTLTAILSTIVVVIGATVPARTKASRLPRIYQGQSSAAKPQSPKKIEFLRDVAPILDRSGCSTADCHGKFGGRGGFQISLLTLSPEDDYEPIVYGARGRRINFTFPEKSLLLQKATFGVPHAGGQRFKVGSPEYNILLRWIKEGAAFDEADPKVTSVSILPAKTTLQKVGSQVQLKAYATYTDGSRKDVTSQTVFQSTNDAVLKVSRDGLTVGQRWGGGAVLGRYLGNVVAAFVVLPQARTGAYPTYKPANVVDDLVFDNLKRLNVLQSPEASDEEFLRRVTLDTLGRLPTTNEHDKFCSSSAPDKRSKLIDDLLANPEYTDFFTLRVCDLLRCSPRKFGQGNGNLADRSAAIYYEWIWNSIAANKPWDQFARELITSKGSSYQVAPTNFYRVENTPNDRMENLGQAFLGVRMSCARCHKHPFDRWTTDDYWNFAAVLGKVYTRGGKLEGENIVEYGHYNQVTNQSVNGRNKGKVAPPTYLGDKTPADNKGNMMEHLADWVVAPDNPFFARASVNRLWSYYFSRGIIHPVDDMRATSPEAVPGLLDALAKEFVESKYDVKHVTKLILNSRLTNLPVCQTPVTRKMTGSFRISCQRQCQRKLCSI